MISFQWSGVMEKERKDCNVVAVRSRQYSECSRRAIERLYKPGALTCDDIFYVLSALPQQQNTRRINVIPANHDVNFVYSQAAGLTTQRNKIPTLSNLCSKCPNLIALLARFVREYEQEYSFTTITINYNYAAAPHKDNNHEGGHARIIALGNFSGGGLNVDTISDDIDIHDKWFDFDGRLTHSTNIFTGERYSLVYFTHSSWRTTALSLARKLISLSVPWPKDDRLSDEHQLCSRGIVLDPAAILQPVQGNLTDTTSSIGNISEIVPSSSYYKAKYIFLPRQNMPQYRSFVEAEVSSLTSLFGMEKSPPSDNIHAQSNIELSSSKFPSTYIFTELDMTPESRDKCKYQILTRAVTFNTLQVLHSSHSVESLASNLAGNPHIKMPDSYSLDVVAYGKQLSTRQRRQITTQLNLSKPPVQRTVNTTINSTNRIFHKQPHHQYRLLLHYIPSVVNTSADSEGLIEVQLCVELQKDSSTVETNKSLDVDNIDTADPSSHTIETDSQMKSNSVPRASATPLKPVMSQLLCNLAKIESGSLVLDLCVGSGSLLTPNAANAGSIGIGCDVYVDENFTNNPMNNFVLANLHHNQIHGDGMFDAVVVDPPYGRRETHVDAYGGSTSSHETNEQRAHDRFKILTPLFITANRVLRPGGRLVFLFFNYPNSDTCAWDAATDLPVTQSTTEPNNSSGLKLLHTCRELWTFQSGHVLARDVCVLEKCV